MSISLSSAKPGLLREKSVLAGSAVVFSAALAMAATLPGRTHGLGLITTRLLADFPGLDAITFAQLNLVATLVGSLFCLPGGWFVDRFGPRHALTVAMLGLSGAAYAMTSSTSILILGLAITLTRGFGQSMLSVVSITMLGKWFHRNAGLAMGSYSVLMTVLLAAGTGLLASRVSAVGWRPAWQEMSLLLVLGWIAAWLTALSPGPTGRTAEDRLPEKEEPGLTSATLREALRSPCFWAFALSITFFGFVSAGHSLFQQLILEQQGLTESDYHVALILGLLAGLTANFAGGALARVCSLATLLQWGMLGLAVSLAVLPLVRESWQAYLQAIGSGLSGGLITVLFFTIWGHAFGPRQLGKIQSVAQMMTVPASAVGPLAVAWGQELTGSYAPVLWLLALLSLTMGVAVGFVPVPRAADGAWAKSLPDSFEPISKEKVS